MIDWYSVGAILMNAQDPCIMLQLQKDLAIQEQRYEDAHALQQVNSCWLSGC
jgi:hypothetical protein